MNDINKETTQALAFLVVGINGSWKLPVAYFFVHGLDGEQKAKLVHECIAKVQETGTTIVPLTFNGATSNITMIKNLDVI